MKPQNKEKDSFSAWQTARLLWWAQFLAVFSFGMPLIAMVLFAANIDLFVALKTILFYLAISFFVYVPFYGILSIIFLKPIKKILDKDYEKNEAVTKEELRVTGRFLNSPLYLSAISFIASFLGFIFGLLILRLGLIPGLMLRIDVITVLGLAVGFVICIVQSSLIYVFLENFYRPQIEFLNRFYPNIIKAIKIIKFPLFWKIFLLALSSVIVSQISLWALYLGRIIIYSSEDYFSEDIKNALIYIGIVAILTLFYIAVIATFSSRNLVYPLKKLILWADKIIKGGTKEEIFLSTNDEITEVIESLKQMHEELESTRASLEIKIKARTKELKELTERQEEIIQERIKEVQKRTEELERFQRLAVGRELKMIELKEEINKLKKHLK